MAEPFSTAAFIAGATANWLFRKGLDWSAASLWASLSPKDFKRLLERAWRSDEKLRTLCDPPPTFDHHRLNSDRWKEILNAVLNSDCEGLSKYLFEEQLIDLPWKNERGPVPASEIGLVAAQVTMEVAVKTIANNAKLSAEFEIFTSQTFQADHTSILAALAELRRCSDELADEFRQHSAASAESDAKQLEMLKEVRDLVKEGLDSNRVSELTSDNIKLEEQLMALLDEKGRATWEEINREWRKRNFAHIAVLSKEFESWLRTEGAKASAVIRGRGFMLLAHVALLSSRNPSPNTEELERAHRFYAEANEAYGKEVSEAEQSRLARFRAKIKAIKGDHDGALHEIASHHDSDAINTKLIVLVDAGRFEDAYEVIADPPNAAEWIEEAIGVFVLTGHVEQADQALQWAIATSDDLGDRCRLAYVRSKLTVANGDSDDEPLSGPFKATIGQQNLIDALLSCLEPVVERVRARNRVETGNEAEIVAIAYAFNRSRGRVKKARLDIELIQDYAPLHEAYVRAAIRGDAPCTTDLAHKVRQDYPDDFSMQLLAANVDWHSHRDVNEILSTLESLYEAHHEASTREELARFAFEVATSRDVDIMQIGRLQTLCEGTPSTSMLLAAYLHVRSGEYEEAESLLSNLHVDDDIVVRQLKAEILNRQDRPAEASQLLAEVGREMCEPFFLRKAAHFARRAGNASESLACLEDSLLLDPDDVHSINQLAIIRVSVGDYLLAAELFNRLASLETDFDYKLDQARCLALAGDAPGALAILDGACQGDDPSLFAVLSKAQLLQDCGRAREGLELLDAHRSRGWKDARFVHVYMTVAFSANSDNAANIALRRLLDLQQALPDSERLLLPYSTDELTAILDERNQTIRQLQTEMLKGRVPWILVERLANNPAMWGWFVRTQDLAWLYEDETTYASYSVYASHGYAALDDEEDGIRSLLPIRCAPSETEIVIDLSAIITLDRLGLLNRVLDYFAKIHVPGSYLTTVLTEGGALLPQQPSQNDELQLIHDAVRDGRLKVCETPEEPNAQIVDEYGERDNASLKIVDILNALEGNEGELLLPALDAPSRLDARKPVEVALSTLQTLAHNNQLGQVLSAFRVFLKKSDFDSIKATLLQNQARHEVRNWHTELWQMLRTHPKVEFESALQYGRDATLDAEQAPSERIIALESISLAESLELPLLADERLCQAARLSARPDLHHAAFGTFEVLESFAECRLLDDRAIDGAILQLIKWRYRFIVLSPNRLRSIYDECGISGLQSVAKYVHDCMRDRGLLAGLESTDVPMPMAYRVYQDWERNIGHFIAALWIDGSVNMEEATSVTEWAMTEFLPSIPRNLQGIQSRLAAFTPSMVLSQMLFDLVPLGDYDRANEALLCVAKHLGISYEEYQKITEDLIGADHGNA